MKLYVGFVIAPRDSGPIGWKVISFFTGSPVVHTFITDLETVWETSETLFEKRPYALRTAGTPVEVFEVIGVDGRPAFTHVESLIGTAYDYPGIIGLGLLSGCERLMNLIAWPIRKLHSLMNKTPMDTIRLAFLNNPYARNKLYFCTETVYHALKKTDAVIPDWWYGENLFAHQMHRYFLDNPDLYKKIG